MKLAVCFPISVWIMNSSEVGPSITSVELDVSFDWAVEPTCCLCECEKDHLRNLTLQQQQNRK